jgi:hypothetical protein
MSKEAEKEVEKEIAALMAQCESALTEYSNRTGALMFSEANKTPATAVKTQAVSEQALEQITKTLGLSLLDMSERSAKLAAKLASKANDLEALKLQRKTLKNKQEEARQVDPTKNRKSMHRTPDSEVEVETETEVEVEVETETEVEVEVETELETETELGQGQSSSESIIQGENVVLKKVTFGNHRRS